MAQQRQPFRFRLPWLAAPQPAPAAPRPSQTTQTRTQSAPAASRHSQGAQAAPQAAPSAPRPSQGAQAPPQAAPSGPRPSQGAQAPSQSIPSAPRPSQTTQAPSSQAARAAPRSSEATQASAKPSGTPAQRAPFRPAGVAQRPPTQPTPSRPPSPSTSPQRTSQPATRPQETRSSQGPPASASHNVSQIQVTSPPASPSQLSSKNQQAKKVPPQPPSPSHGDFKATRPTATTVSSQANLPSPTKEPLNIKTEISQNSVGKRESSKPPSEDPKPPQKVVDSLGEPKKPANEVYTTSYTEPKQIPKGKQDNHKKEAASDKDVQGSKTQTKAHPLADEQGRQSEEEVHDVKEVLKNIENTGPDTEREIRSHERVPKFPQRHAETGGQKASFHKEIKENLPKLSHKQGSQREKHLSYEKPLSIVTLTGENNGATMHLGSESPNKRTPIHIHRGYKIKPDDSADTTTDGEGSSRNRKSGNTKLQEELATKSNINNNVQGLNNSLVFNSTVTERDPGVHLVHYCKPVEPTKPEKEKEMLNTHRIEVTRTPADRVAYAPTIRRRCLRGLMLESSDSDPEKPRRHGCRAVCTQRNKDGKIDLL